ncbi:hypothetical protein [Thalassobacillus devorans]|nr:hypothetical protein [Thalassobacillus devorans]
MKTLVFTDNYEYMNFIGWLAEQGKQPAYVRMDQAGHIRVDFE